VPLANIRNQYFEFLKSLNQKQSEQNTDGVHCFYAYLVPLAADGDRAFAKFVDYLKTSQAVRTLLIHSGVNSTNAPHMPHVPCWFLEFDLTLFWGLSLGMKLYFGFVTSC